MSQPPFESVLTPTANRRAFLPVAIACFKAQTYPQDRMEWIVLDDGEDKVGDLFAAAGLKNVRYYAETEKLRIGAKRNKMNALAKGEICICWDDDDYYPADRVRVAVTRLRSSPGRAAPVVGASMVFLYLSDRNEIWSAGPYAQNHCTNGTMAYWRSYTADHRYEDDADKAEERFFMNGWTTPVLQIQPEKTMLVICHAGNTFDKRVLFLQHNPMLKKVHFKLKDIVKEKWIRDFYATIGEEYRKKPIVMPSSPPT